MAGVDSQFIDYLKEIGAKFTVYHTGTKPRIQLVSTSVKTQAPVTVSSIPVAKKPVVSNEDSELQVIYDTQLTEDYRNRTSFDIFKNNFLLLKRMGIPVEDIIKNMCK
jgi:hypothetical protein